MPTAALRRTPEPGLGQALAAWNRNAPSASRGFIDACGAGNTKNSLDEKIQNEPGKRLSYYEVFGTIPGTDPNNCPRTTDSVGRHVKKGLSKTGGNYNADANSDGKVSVKELGNPSTSEEGAGVQDFPEFVKSLPELETPFPNVHGWLLQGRNQQVAFVHFTEETDVPEHSHRAQWEIIIAGEVRLKLNGRENVYRAGQSFFIPEGRPHGAVVSKDFRSVILFDQPDRFQAK